MQVDYRFYFDFYLYLRNVGDVYPHLYTQMTISNELTQKIRPRDTIEMLGRYDHKILETHDF